MSALPMERDRRWRPLNVAEAERLIASDGEELRLDDYPAWAHAPMRELFRRMVAGETPEAAQQRTPAPRQVADARDIEPPTGDDTPPLPLANPGGDFPHPTGLFRIESRRFPLRYVSKFGSHAYSALVDPDGYTIATRHYEAYDPKTGNRKAMGGPEDQIRAFEYLRDPTTQTDKHATRMDEPGNQAFMVYEGTEDEMLRKWLLGRARGDQVNRMNLRYEWPNLAKAAMFWDHRVRNSNAGNHADVDAMSEGRPFVLPTRDTHRDVWATPGIKFILGDSVDAQSDRLPPLPPGMGAPTLPDLVTLPLPRRFRP